MDEAHTVPHGAASPERDVGRSAVRRRNPAQFGPAGPRPGRQGALWQHAAQASAESHRLGEQAGFLGWCPRPKDESS